VYIKQLYKEVTARIVADLEKGVATWTRPWKLGNGGNIMPRNAVTCRSYNGINIPILWDAQERKGYPSADWLTYNQAKQAGAQVRGGERATTVVFTKRLTVGEEDEERQISMMRCFSVFNVAQIDGLLIEPSKEETAQPSPQTAADLFITATKADIRIGGDRACYVPSLDHIRMPPEQAFTGREHYLATELHELTHWSGHKDRLNRDLGNRFGTKAYAAEELIAELGAAFLCAHLGIEGQLRHAEYIASWIELLKEDERAIFTASSKASQAADYLRGFSGKIEDEQEV